MKFLSPIVVFVAFFSAHVDANGVCYDPNHGSSMDASSVQADMKTIAGAGFSSVRTYISKFGNTEMGPIIAAAGLTAVLGVPYPQSDYQEQMEAAISAANSGGVYAIMVGNENLAGASSVPSDMIDVINQIKSRVTCKVGSVQRNTEVIGHQSISGWSDLISAVDVLGVNAHPFFNPGTTADGAIDVLDTQWQTMMGSFGDKLLLTETGWPSSGSVSGNTGSLSGAQTFYSAYQQWSSSLGEKFYFQSFDTPSKAETYEQSFGLYTSDSQPKFTMSQQQSSPSTSTSQQQQQTTTSAPTTEAPAPTTAAPTSKPTPEPTTAAPKPTTATPESTTATVTSTPETHQSSSSSETHQSSGSSETHQSSGSSETHQSSGSSDTNSTSSASGSDKSIQQGSASFTGSGNDMQVSSSSKGSSTEQDSKTGSNSEQTTQTTTETTQSTTATNSIGKSSETQQEQTTSKDHDNTQQANTQSEGSSSGGMVGLAVAGGACAMLVAFGFIYQTRKRAQEMEEDDKDARFSVITPAENICAL